MKQKLLKTLRLLFVAVGLGVGMSAWADETVTELTTVGADDNSAAWFTAFSKSYTLGANQTLSISFKNYSSKSENWHNWVAYVTSDADRGSCNEYIALRADNAGWGTRWVASNLTSNYNWETFKTDMDGSTVNMTVTRNGALVTIHADITTTGGTEYYENYYTACGSGTQNLRFFLTVEKAHLTDITSSITDNGNTSDSENWGIENAHIDFSNAISSNSVAGETNSITGTSTRWVKGYNDIDALSNIIRIGSVAGTVTIPDAQLAGSKDEVIISFDIWFGKLGRTVYFQLYDNAAEPYKIADFTRNFYSGSTSVNTFELDESKITSIGDGSHQNDAICVDANKTTFNIHLNYQTGKMYVVQYTNGEWKQTTSEVSIGTINPLKRFVIGSGYDNENRRCWLDNIFIYTKKGDYNTTANITLAFEDNEGNDISALYTGVSSFTPEKGETFTPSDYYPAVMYDDDYKYTYTSGGDAFEVTADREVVLVYTKTARPTYTFNVTANYGGKNKKIIDEVSVKEAADYTYYYPRFIKDGSTLYEYASSTDANASESYWTSTHTNVVADGTYTLTYNAIEGNCVYYSEGEDVEGAVEYTAFKRYMSGGSSAVFDSGKTLTTLGAGVYKVTVRSLGRSSGDRHAYLYKTSTDGELILHKVVSSNSGTDDSATFSLDGSTDIVAQGGYSTTSENGAGIDYVYIMKLPDNVSKPITAAGWATYCSPYALDLENATNLTDAYIVTGGSDGVLTKTSVKGGTVPANTGLLLKGTEGSAVSVTIPVVVSSTTNVDANILEGVTADTPIAAEAGWVLMASPSLGFYQNANAFTVGANTAYIPVSKLPVPVGGSARAFFSLDDESTGIKSVQGSEQTVNGYYNLNGQRVEKPAKGLYIVNGKKVVMK